VKKESDLEKQAPEEENSFGMDRLIKKRSKFSGIF